MKKQLLRITMVALAFLGFNQLHAQVTFNNGGGDNLWSNTANWVGGVLPTSADEIILAADATLDLNGVGSKVTLGNGSYTITGTAGAVSLTLSDNAQLVKNSKDEVLTFDCDVDLAPGDGAANVDSSNNPLNKIIFAAGKTLTLTGPTVNFRNYSPNPMEVNGNVDGAGTLNLHKGSIADLVFGSTADLSAHTGQISLVDNDGVLTNVISNINGPGLFRAANAVVKISQPGLVVTINGANTLEGTVNSAIAGAASTLDLNANQNNIGNLKVGADNCTLNLDIDPVVTEVVVNTLQVQNATRILNIIGFQEDVLDFTFTLTADQLSRITHDGAGGALAQRPTGELVYATTLSNDKNTLEGVSIYPNPASSFIKINSPRGGDVALYNILGSLVKSQKDISRNYEMNVSDLKSGLYLLKVTSENATMTQKVVIK